MSLISQIEFNDDILFQASSELITVEKKTAIFNIYN